jgi:hypothetical protein
MMKILFNAKTIEARYDCSFKINKKRRRKKLQDASLKMSA